MAINLRFSDVIFSFLPIKLISIFSGFFGAWERNYINPNPLDISDFYLNYQCPMGVFEGR